MDTLTLEPHHCGGSYEYPQSMFLSRNEKIMYEIMNSCGHVGTVSYLTTLFMGKPPGGSLPVLSAHSFLSN